MMRFALQFVLVLACASPLAAQVPSGAVAGAVTDQNGGILANATITVTNKATGLSRVAAGGRCLLRPSLPAGRYDVLVVAQGFQPTASFADVVTGSTTTVRVSLEVGTRTETVMVTGAATAVDLSSNRAGVVAARRSRTCH
jgi:hypothetical protein